MTQWSSERFSASSSSTKARSETSAQKPTTQLTVDSPVSDLKGVGPKTALALAEAGVDTIARLLLHGPLRYQDRSQIIPLAELKEADCWVTVRCQVIQARLVRLRRRGMSMIEAEVEDSSARTKVVWFNQRSIPAALAAGNEVLLYGVVRLHRDKHLRLVNPDVERWPAVDGFGTGLVPVYGKLGPLSGKRLRKVMKFATQALESIEDPLPPSLRSRLRLPGLADALSEVHQPSDVETVSESGRERIRVRLAFDEALAFHCAVEEQAGRIRCLRAPSCRVDDQVRGMARDLLPFKLTQGQRRVMAEIAADLQQSRPMARLLQGDVGSGKTIVAALSMLIAVESGHQAAIMAPTEILAEQHLATLEPMFANARQAVGLLTGSQPAAQRREVVEALASGQLRLVVGTHALVQDRVRFQRLGLAIVDEQHRFGVRDRQRLVDKGWAPHLLVMTATPIPRSLALTAFGDLDVSVIDDLPPGRQVVRTEVRDGSAREAVLAFVAQEVAEGGRAFVVFPLIDPSEKVQARALTEHADELRQQLPGIDIAVVHGRLGRAERDAGIESFRDGSVKVLLATSVVEVGVDVPEATVMVVESADRFGLAQLHQLRGRVGRGSRKSWCILLTEPGASPESRARLSHLARCESGFEVAEADLEQRGAGELAGTRQWGSGHFHFLNLVRDAELLAEARAAARELARSGRLSEVKRRLAKYHRTDLEIQAG